MKVNKENFEEKLLKSAEQAVKHTELEAAWEYAAKLRKKLTEVEYSLTNRLSELEEELEHIKWGLCQECSHYLIE